MSYLTDSRRLAAEQVIANFQKRNMNACYCATKEEAREKILSMIPKGSAVSNGGSESLAEAGILAALRDGDYRYIDRTAGNTPQEKKAVYAQAATADYFLTGVNAFTAEGELVNVDGNGNRVACLICGPDHVIVLAGMNKLCPDVPYARARIQTLASPPNALRVGAKTPCAKTGLCSQCLSPDCICAHTVITRFSRTPGRITVVLVGEPLGF